MYLQYDLLLTQKDRYCEGKSSKYYQIKLLRDLFVSGFEMPIPLYGNKTPLKLVKALMGKRLRLEQF